MKHLLCLGLFLWSQLVFSAALKVGVLAPEGTAWAQNCKKMATEIKQATGDKVDIKFYFGGSQGDEPDVLRKIHIGQLHGGIFTGKTLGDIYGDVRVIEIPFTFNGNREKAFKTLNKLTPFFNQGFEKNNFKNLGFFEIGFVYLVSQKKTSDIENLKGVKIWSWQGDRIVETLVETMKLVSVPLALPDVLSSLSTGIIEAAYAPPMGIVALQWNTKIKYLVDFPISYSVGAFLLDSKAWNNVSPEHRKIVEEISKKYISNVNLANINDNVEALKAMKQAGVEFLTFPEADVKVGSTLRKEIMSKLKGKLFSENALSRLEKEL